MTIKTRRSGVLYIRNLPRALKDKFKSLCVLRGDQMEDVIASLVHTYIESPEKFPVRKRGRSWLTLE